MRCVLKDEGEPMLCTKTQSVALVVMIIYGFPSPRGREHPPIIASCEEHRDTTPFKSKGGLVGNI